MIENRYTLTENIDSIFEEITATIEKYYLVEILKFKINLLLFLFKLRKKL